MNLLTQYLVHLSVGINAHCELLNKIYKQIIYTCVGLTRLRTTSAQNREDQCEFEKTGISLHSYILVKGRIDYYHVISSRLFIDKPSHNDVKNRCTV